MSEKNNKKNNNKKNNNKKLLGLIPLFALLFASKGKINKKIEEKKEEIAKEQWTKKNSVTLISMQELEKRISEEESTLDTYINAEDKEIEITDISDFWRFPSDSEGVSYLNSLYIIPYINSNDSVLIRDFSISFIDRDSFAFRDKKTEIFKKYHEQNFFYFDTKNKYSSKYAYSDLQSNKGDNNITIVNRDIESLGLSEDIALDYRKSLDKIGIKKEGINILKNSTYGTILRDRVPVACKTIGQYYKISEKDRFTDSSSDFSLEKDTLNLFKVVSFGFRKNPSRDIGIFLFIPFSFFCPKMEKGRKFTFEKLYIDDILIQTKEQVETNGMGGLNNGLSVLSLLDTEEFKSDEILLNKKNQIDLLNFIKKDYVVEGENNFIFPILLYYPLENLDTYENVGLYANEGVNIYDLFYSYYNTLYKEESKPSNLRDDTNLEYFLYGAKKIKQISFSIHYNFNELGRELTNFKIVCKFGEMEDKVDLSNISNFEITTYSTKYPEYQKGSGILNNLNIGDIFVEQVKMEDFDDEFFFSTKDVFQDETIRNYQNNFSEKFNYWINHNVVFDPLYSDNDISIEYPKLK